MNKRKFLMMFGLAAIPSVTLPANKPDGVPFTPFADIEWHYDFFDYENQIGICGEYGGRRVSARYMLPFVGKRHATAEAAAMANPKLTRQAQSLIAGELYARRGLPAEQVQEGNELSFDPA
jgi:hypothetical protein